MQLEKSRNMNDRQQVDVTNTVCSENQSAEPLNRQRNRNDLKSRSILIVKALFAQTTAHGFNRVHSARGNAKKIFWIIVMLGSASALIFSMIRLTIKYATHPAATDISVNKNSHLTFPAVTFCNVNPAKKSAIDGLKTATSSSSKRRKKRDASVGVRLVNGNYHRGRLEVLHNETWGTVCDDGFDKVNARVACFSLGFGYVGRVLSTSAFGRGSGQIWLDGVYCVGTETSLNDCSHNPWGVNDCSHEDDVAIACGVSSNDTDDDAMATPSAITTSTVTTSETKSAVATTTTTTTTTALLDTATIPLTEQRMQCCCRCCDQEQPPTSCSSCSRPSVAEAVSCATPTPAPPTPTRSPEPNFVAPETVAGSKFPDRLAPTAQFSSMQQLTEQIASLPVSEKSDIGFKLSDFIVSCQYNGEMCNLERDFSVFYNPIHANCYIYNSGWNATRPLQQSLQPGISHGLSMIMNIQQSEYTAGAGDTAGIVVVIKQQNVMPFPEDEGLIISPGHATSIGLTLRSIERLPQPFGDCWDPTVVNTSNNAYADHYPVSYSSTACQKTCYQRNVITQCGCYDVYYPSSNSSAFNFAEVPICSATNVTQGDCLYQVSKMFVNGMLKCDCPDRCTEDTYSISSSFGSWPASNSKVGNCLTKYLQRLIKSQPGTSANLEDQAFVENNLLKVDVYFSDFTSEVISYSKGYPASQLWTDTNGVVGLWYGLSVMTCMELIVFVIDIALLALGNLIKHCSIRNK